MRAARCSCRAASIWRHLDFDDFRAECPGGDEALQRLIWERLDDALAWLVSLGAEPVWEDTENPRTTGKRFDPRALTRCSRATSSSRRRCRTTSSRRSCSRPAGSRDGSPRSEGLLLRANPWSDGAGLDYATRARRGASPAGWASSTAARCRRRRRGSARRTSCRSRSSTGAGRASSPTTAARSRRRASRGTRTTSRSASARARGTSLDDEASSTRGARGRTRRGRDGGRFGRSCRSTTPPGIARRRPRRRRASRTRSAACASTRARASQGRVDGLYAAGVDAGGVAPAATRAASRRRSCSGSSRRRTSRLNRSSRCRRWTALRSAEIRALPLVAGSGDGATFVTRSSSPSCSTSAPTAGTSPSRSRSS